MAALAAIFACTLQGCGRQRNDVSCEGKNKCREAKEETQDKNTSRENMDTDRYEDTHTVESLEETKGTDTPKDVVEKEVSFHSGQSGESEEKTKKKNEEWVSFHDGSPFTTPKKKSPKSPSDDSKVSQTETKVPQGEDSADDRRTRSDQKHDSKSRSPLSRAL